MSKAVVCHSEANPGAGFVVGTKFCFLLPGLAGQAQAAGVRVPDVIGLVGEGEVTVLGVQLARARMADVPLNALCPTQMLYEPQETVCLMRVCPSKRNGVECVEILRAGDKVAGIEVRLDAMGCALVSVRDLAEGNYTARIQGTEVTAEFQVARFQLSPLEASYVGNPTLVRNGAALRVRIRLSRFEMPVAGKVRVEVMAGQARHSSVDAEVCEGLVEAEVDLPPGEATLSLNLVFGEASASLPIRGGRESERAPFRANPLGQVVCMSALSQTEQDSETRGLYFSCGEVNNEPFAVPAVVTDKGTIEVRAAGVEVARIVVVDPVAGEAREIPMPETRPGSKIGFALPGPYGVVFIGAIIDGKPYEAYTVLVRPVGLKVEVEVPPRLLPGEEAELTVSTNQPGEDVSVWVTITDGRAVTPQTVVKALGARIKEGAARHVEDVVVGEPDNAFARYWAQRELQLQMLTERGDETGRGMAGLEDLLERLMGRSRRTGRRSGPEVRLMAESTPVLRALRSGPSVSLGRSSEALRARLASYGDEPAIANVVTERTPMPPPPTPGPTECTPLPNPRERTAKTVLCRLIAVNGTARVAFRAPAAITGLNVMVQAVSGYDAVCLERPIRVTKDLYAEFSVAPFVAPGDQALGQLTVGCAAGAFRVAVTREGAAIPLHAGREQIGPDETVTGTQAVFTFDLQPGEYEAVVTAEPDAAGASVAVTGGITQQVDRARVVVTEPGRFVFDVNTLMLLRAGESVEIPGPETVAAPTESAWRRWLHGQVSEPDESIRRIVVLPGLNRVLKTAAKQTADYTHLCCEQTAAKIAAAALVYVGGDDSDRDSSESIILAGIRREARMFEPGQGFRIYPDSNHLSTHYSELAARHLRSGLGALSGVPNPSAALKAGIAEGLRMASDAATAHGLKIPPEAAGCCRDAYEILASGAPEPKRQAAIRFVQKQLLPEKTLLAAAGHGGGVAQRAETAFAAAALFRAGETYWGDAFRAANWVTAQMREHGAWYSTVDSIAGLALLSEVARVGAAGAGAGLTQTVLINGEPMSLQQALAVTEPIRSLRLPEGFAGMLPVGVTRRRAESWDEFCSGARVAAGLRLADGAWVQRGRPGQALELLVKLVDGYRDGDLCHVCLPPCLSFVYGGGQVRAMAVDFEGRNELCIPVAVTAVSGDQHWALCVRNMFEEERGGNPGPQRFQVVT